MTEPPALMPTDAESGEAAPPLAAPQPAPRRTLLPVLLGTGFLALAAAIYWTWQHPLERPDTRLDALSQQVATLDSRVAKLEQRPASAPVDLGPLTQRVAALEQRPPATTPVATPDLAPLAAKVAALEQRPTVNLAPLDARIAALEAKQPADSQLVARLDALSAREDALDTGQRVLQADITRRLDADEARLTSIERNASQIATLADKANRLARIQTAQAALESGQKLGDIPGAPLALTRFANAAPPTIATLRLGFPDAARAALSAAKPPVQDKPLLGRIWAEAQELVTVRQDGRVVIGDPAVGVLDQARAALDAGDLPAAIAAVASLSGPAAQAMAAWLAEAHSLQDARAALAELAAHA